MEQLTLRQIRLAKEITVEQMAKELDIHPNTYAIWEKSPWDISLTNAYKICSILGVEFCPHIFLDQKSTENVDK